MAAFLVFPIGGCESEEARDFGINAEGRSWGDGGVGGSDGGLQRGPSSTSDVVTPAGTGGGAGATDVNGSGGAGARTGGASSGGAIGSGGSGSGGVSGSGGAAIGGRAGTGGAAAVGSGGVGAVASGGRSVATGGAAPSASGGAGVAASGGRPAATGGAPATASGGAGTGGRPATGGAPGSGGAPISGSGGASVVVQTTAECLQYIAEYAAELVLAKDCNDGGGPGSNNGNGNGNGNGDNDAQTAPMCGALVPVALAGCGANCSTYVNKPSKLDQLQQKWVNARCVDPVCAKPSVCAAPTGGTCAAGTGRCSDL